MASTIGTGLHFRHFEQLGASVLPALGRDVTKALPVSPHSIQADTLDAAASAMGVDASHLGAELSQYCTYGTGSDSDPYGKAVFPHAPDPAQQLPFYIARVTPVVGSTWRTVYHDLLRPGERPLSPGCGTDLAPALQGVPVAPAVQGTCEAVMHFGG